MNKQEMNAADIARAAKHASFALAAAPSNVRDNALLSVAAALRAKAGHIFAANEKDMEAAEKEGLSAPALKRLRFDEHKLNDVCLGSVSYTHLLVILLFEPSLLMSTSCSGLKPPQREVKVRNRVSAVLRLKEENICAAIIGSIVMNIWKLRSSPRAVPPCLSAVSYTHLDVYKRQGDGCGFRPIPERKLKEPLFPAKRLMKTEDSRNSVFTRWRTEFQAFSFEGRCPACGS